MSTKTVEEEFTVTDELYQITEATNKDGTVDVQIYNWEKIEKDGEPFVKVWFYTPSMEPRWEDMPWPTIDTLDNKFVRVCETAGVGLKGADWLRSDGAEIRADPENWIIQTQLPARYRIKRYIDQLSVQDILIMSGFVTFIGFAAIDIIALFGMPIYGLLTILGWVPAAPTSVVGWIVLWFISFFFVGMIGEAIDE